LLGLESGAALFQVALGGFASLAAGQNALGFLEVPRQRAIVRSQFARLDQNLDGCLVILGPQVLAAFIFELGGLVLLGHFQVGLHPAVVRCELVGLPQAANRLVVLFGCQGILTFLGQLAGQLGEAFFLLGKPDFLGFLSFALFLGQADFGGFVGLAPFFGQRGLIRLFGLAFLLCLAAFGGLVRLAFGLGNPPPLDPGLIFLFQTQLLGLFGFQLALDLGGL